MSLTSLSTRVSENFAWPRQASPKLKNVSAMLGLHARAEPALSTKTPGAHQHG